MSTDVYVDFDEPLTLEERIAHGADWPSERIGHLAAMSFQYPGYWHPLIESLRVLDIASGGVVLTWVPDAVETVVKHWRAALTAELARWKSPADFCGAFGVQYSQDTEDAPEAGELRELFNENLGRRWSIRVD